MCIHITIKIFHFWLSFYNYLQMSCKSRCHTISQITNQCNVIICNVSVSQFVTSYLHTSIQLYYISNVDIFNFINNDYKWKSMALKRCSMMVGFHACTWQRIRVDYNPFILYLVDVTWFRHGFNSHKCSVLYYVLSLIVDQFWWYVTHSSRVSYICSDTICT